MTVTTHLQHPRSAFAAAFLSFLFPGLGQLYAGRPRRALAFAAPALAAILVVAALVGLMGVVDLGLWLAQTSVLGPLAVLNVVALLYRGLACLDAYGLALRPEALPTTPVQAPAEPAPAPAPSGSARRRLIARLRAVSRNRALSAAGLVAVMAVLLADHAFAGYWDIRFYQAESDIYAPIELATPNPSDEPLPTVSVAPQETVPPAPTFAPWKGTGRLNILLVGVDADAAFRTDTMMVVSVEPTTHQVAMFSIPRDTYGLPMPPRSRLSSVWGPYYNYKLNTLWRYSDKYRQLFPHGGVDALKAALGYTFFGDQNAISYYMLVDFQGFQKVVDTFGGVTIDVPVPVIDDGYPGNAGSGHSGYHYRVYIPAGIQHMNGDQALTYARSRHGSGDVDRQSRQQRILVALQQQANIDQISAHLSELVDALSSTIHTDIPQGPEVLGSLLRLARSIKSDDIKTYAFGPPTYASYVKAGSSGSGLAMDVAAIRKVVKAALAGQPEVDLLQTALDEHAPMLVQNGTATVGQDVALASYLNSLGFDAQASTAVPTQLGGTTRLISVNGAADDYPATFAQLKAMLGLTGAAASDPLAPVSAATDATGEATFIIVTGTNTPTFTPLPSAGS